MTDPKHLTQPQREALRAMAGNHPAPTQLVAGRTMVRAWSAASAANGQAAASLVRKGLASVHEGPSPHAELTASGRALCQALGYLPASL